MEHTISVFFGGSIIGVLFAIGLLFFFWKWTRSTLVVVVVGIFLVVTRFSMITVEPKRGEESGGIEVVGETRNE